MTIHAATQKKDFSKLFFHCNLFPFFFFFLFHLFNVHLATLLQHKEQEQRNIILLVIVEKGQLEVLGPTT